MRHRRLLTCGAIVLLCVLVGSCARDAAAPADRPAIQMAKGSGGGGAPKGGPAVTATDPKGAPQNITLNVRVLGSGFDLGSRVSFERGGVASGKVVTNSTSYVSATELLANVTIAADADTAKYDVVVLTSKGIKGIGSVLFEVVGDPPSSWLIPVDDGGFAMTGDGNFLSGTYSKYQSGVCGVDSRIFATVSASNSGDAIVNTHNPKYAQRKCTSYPRKIMLRYPDGSSELTSFNANVQLIQNTTNSIPVGSTITRAMNIAGGARCGILKFRPLDKEGVVIGGDSVVVTRVNSFTWDVQSRPYPDNKASCMNNGQVYHMNVRFRIESELPMP